MMTGKNDLLQSLIEAFLMEKGTNIFYSQAAAKTANAEARKMFQDLTAWEEKHMEFIQFLYQSIQGDRDIEGFEAFQAKTDAPMTEAGIPVKDLESKVEKLSFSDDTEAYQIALDIESKAYNLYRKLSAGAADGNARAVFSEMMEQEQKHIDYLKKTKGKFA
ncbi:MAG: ferritin family protein [Thermodesulfovibrionales bacterium]